MRPTNDESTSIFLDDNSPLVNGIFVGKSIASDKPRKKNKEIKKKKRRTKETISSTCSTDVDLILKKKKKSRFKKKKKKRKRLKLNPDDVCNSSVNVISENIIDVKKMSFVDKKKKKKKRRKEMMTGDTPNGHSSK